MCGLLICETPLKFVTTTLILGAGPAGLSAGFYLSRAGHDVTLLEAAPEPGGFARTFAHGPFRYDAGAHRFHDKDAEITRDLLELMGDELLKVHAPSQICWQGKFLDFPLSPANLARKLGPLKLVRASLDFTKARVSAKRDEQNDFASGAYRRYGKTIADEFLIGYSEKLWGIPAEQLSPAVSGGRLKGLSARTLLTELLRGKLSKSEHLDGSFYYPRGGYGKIVDRLSERIGRERIHTNCRILKLRHDALRITGIELAGGSVLTPERVVNSLAPSTTLRLLEPAPPQALVELADTLKFRDLMLVTVMLDRPRVTRNASIYFPSPEIPFTRLYEPKNRSIELAPPKQTCVVVEIPCGSSEEMWNLSDDALKAQVVEHLSAVKLIRPNEVLDSRVHRLRAAYPVLEVGSEEVVAELRDFLSRFVNLYTVGRAGRFEYTHVHDLMRQAKDLAKLLKVERAELPAFDSA